MEEKEGKVKIEIPQAKIQDFCKKWKIKTFYFFGSVLTEEFDPGRSDVDVMIEFLPEAKWSLFEYVDMKEELETVFQRSVDLVTKYSVEKSRNTYRKKSILESAKVIYEQAA